MKKDKIVKILGLAVMLSILGTSMNAVQAVSQNDVKNIDSKIEDAKDDLNDVQTNKSAMLKSIEDLTTQITDYEDQISKLSSEITDLNDNIKKSQERINVATEEYNKQQDLLNERLVALYEAGDTTYLDVLLSSKGVTDFISNYFLVSELASYDTELLEKIENQRKQIEEAKKELEDSKAKIESAKKEKQTKSNELKTKKTEKNNQVAKLSQDEKNIQASLDQFEADKRKIKNELAEIARKEAEEAAEKGEDYGGGNPSACGYIFPVLGLGKGNIANKQYPSYGGHTGVDVNIGVVGKTIVAVKAGTVITSEALKYSDGSYRSYGEYIVINHHDGTMTLYAHGLQGSRKVSAGQKVSQGQAIMTVGSTGNSSGPHLHFEVRVGGYPVNPLPYLP